jgi:hypothetical protein
MLMDEVGIVLAMLLAVVASGYLVRMLPFAVPLPLMQIALGAAIAGSTGHGVRLEPHIFFLVFLPPLLFLDGWRIPKVGLFRDRSTILELALGLVLFTVLGAGFLIHWLIPSGAHRSGRGVVDRRARADPAAPDAHPRGRIAAERRQWPGVLPLRRGRCPDRHLFAGRSHAHVPVGRAGGRGHRRGHHGGRELGPAPAGRAHRRRKRLANPDQ